MRPIMSDTCFRCHGPDKRSRMAGMRLDLREEALKPTKSGATTASPKLVWHSHQSYPVGHQSTMYWIGIQPGDVHRNISSLAWAKHAFGAAGSPPGTPA